jgi:hypothetical protein
MKIKLKVYNFAFICNGDHREAHCLKNISFLTAGQKNIWHFTAICTTRLQFSPNSRSILQFLSVWCSCKLQYHRCTTYFMWNLLQQCLLLKTSWEWLTYKKSAVHDKNDRNIHFSVKMTDSIWNKEHSVAINAWKSYAIQKTCIFYWIQYYQNINTQHC